MFFSFGVAALLGLDLVAIANAAKHKAFVANEGGPDVLYTIEFDDEALTLDLVANNSLPAASGWLALSGDKRTLYSTNMGDISGTQPMVTSYSIDDFGNITYSGEILSDNVTADAGLYVWAGANPKLPNELHMVALEFQTVVSVTENGSLSSVIQNFEFGNESYVHGAVFHPSAKFIYSMDVDRNEIWTHAIDETTGEITLVATTAVESPVDGPRHGAVHPNGEKLYIITETSNHVAQLSINGSGIPTWDGVYYSLLQPGQNTSDFWCSEVSLSPSNSLLWAAKRGRTTAYNGSVGLWTLDESGAIEKQNFLVDTATSGGLSNLVQPVLFSDRYVALPDLEARNVEMWELSDDHSSVTTIAHLDLNDGGCCQNVVWWS